MNKTKKVICLICAAALLGLCGCGNTSDVNLHIIDRMGNNCVNIAEAVSGSVDFGYFTE